MSIASTSRFSNRVENYVKYRPGYPQEVVTLLANECGLQPGAVVVDVGSGTGISSELFLQNGNIVYGVEPNKEMREAAERLLENYGEQFRSISATAEATNLPDASCQLIVAGQAFHWFDRTSSKREFARILKPGGFVVLIWNERRTDATPFLADYESLLVKFGTDYQEVNHTNIDESVIAEFFRPGSFKLRTFHNAQTFDFPGLKGRLLSSSYAPEAGHPNHQPMLAELERIFLDHAKDDRVIFEYETRVYYGKLE